MKFLTFVLLVLLIVARLIPFVESLVDWYCCYELLMFGLVIVVVCCLLYLIALVGFGFWGGFLVV